jgi:hypothetical protein
MRNITQMDEENDQDHGQMGFQDEIPAEDNQVASFLVPTSPIEPHSPEQPPSPIEDPIQDIGPNVPHNQVVAPLVPNNQVGSNQGLFATLGPQQIQPTREKKLALANASRKKQLRRADLTEALTFMRSLPDGDCINLDDAELIKHNFTEAEFDTLLQLFTENPLPLDTGEQTLRFIENIETLTEHITSDDAARFKIKNLKIKNFR